MSAESDVKYVVICADDFGMNHAIDSGIVQLGALGRLSATSCMSRGPTFADNAPALKATGIQTGLHLNFTEAFGAQGLYLPLAQLIRSAYARRLNLQAVHHQICDQLDRFEDVLGRAPHFVDGHQHVHQLPQIRSVLLDVLQRRYRSGELPWLRRTRAARLTGIPVSQRLKAHVIQALGSRALARGAQASGLGLNTRFAGVYDFSGGEAVYRALLASWFEGLQDGDLLMCHPAAEPYHADPLGAQRWAEFNVLASDDAQAWMQRARIVPRLTGFSYKTRTMPV